MNPALKTLQLLIGMMLGAIALIGVLGGAGYYFFITQMSSRPPKPIFAEERGGGKAAAKPKAKTTAPKAAASPTPSPAATQSQDPDAPAKLPPEAFDAKVIWKDGLSLKKEPEQGAEKVGGVAFNAKVAIVKTSEDKQWVLIRSQVDNAEGWVRAGNIDKAAAALNDESNEEAKPAPVAKPKAKAPGASKPQVKNNATN